MRVSGELESTRGEPRVSENVVSDWSTPAALAFLWPRHHLQGIDSCVRGTGVHANLNRVNMGYIG